ncbi:NAD(P)H-binding protein [Bacillus mangrovi]|uniref:NAD(P)H-binding protein n=1 Tax=Metabacillus mangrovi TaxID=1491830 RepID=A0A7X2S3W6_9BACI|nr:SDR family oxidoreductase [Metabacillus mangrovi]MTH53164.1 NAD(P)H-binding protein [Metabacillus mangrovi]
MKVLIAGANGSTGRYVIEKTAQKGYHPIAMIRDEKQAEDLEKLGASTIVADLEGELSEAVQGADAVIFAAGSGSGTGDDKTIAVDQNGAQRLIDAAKKHNVKKFVMLSSIGTDSPEEGPEEMKTYLNAKAAADQYLRDSELNYTIVRPGALTDDEGSGQIEAAKQVNHEGSIPREDVAEVLVECLSEESARDQTFEIISGNSGVKEAVQSIM